MSCGNMWNLFGCGGNCQSTCTENRTMIGSNIMIIWKKNNISPNLKTQASHLLRISIPHRSTSWQHLPQLPQSDGNCVHVQRKRFFLHNISGNAEISLQRWIQHLSLPRAARTSIALFSFDDLVTWYLQNYGFNPISTTDYSLFYRL